MEPDVSRWSGDGDFTRKLVDTLATLPEITALRVEDAPAGHAGTGYAFLSNEIYVAFARQDVRQPVTDFTGLETGERGGRSAIRRHLQQATVRSGEHQLSVVTPTDAHGRNRKTRRADLRHRAAGGRDLHQAAGGVERDPIPVR